MGDGLNLLAALLAKGQRVLVVSEKAQALAVLEERATFLKLLGSYPAAAW